MKKMGFTEKVTLDYSPALGFIDKEELAGMAPRVRQVHQVLHEKTGPGREYLGWLEWPLHYEGMSFRTRRRPKDQEAGSGGGGIGGSFGARAGLEMLPAAAGVKIGGQGAAATN